MQNILITTSSFGTYDSSVIETMESAGFNLVFNPYGRKLTEAEIKDLVMQHSPVGILAGVEPLTRDVFSVAEGLKTIARCGIGMDSVDQTAAADMGISVTNTPDGPTRAVAELVLGAVLSLLRGMHTSDTSIRAGKWVRPFGELLHGKRVGLLGCGRIGSMAAGLFRAFGCEVFGSDPVNVLEDGIMLAPNELVRRCDIVSLHLPYTKQNHHIMDRAMVESMKRGSVVVNTSRGGLLDETAVYEALVSGHLGGAVIDTFEEEPYHGPLAGLDNVLLTAHIGSYARECRVMMEQQAVENLLEAIERMLK